MLQRQLRPGFVRVAFSFHMQWEEVAFLIRAVEWVAEYGGELLSEYTFIPESGEWKHTRYRYERTLLDVHSLFATKLCHFFLCF